jgi:hypothetical protein
MAPIVGGLVGWERGNVTQALSGFGPEWCGGTCRGACDLYINVRTSNPVTGATSVRGAPLPTLWGAVTFLMVVV